jgi:hypothetical protein
MLTLSRVVQASRSRGAEIGLWASQPNSGPGERGEFTDLIAYRRG